MLSAHLNQQPDSTWWSPRISHMISHMMISYDSTDPPSPRHRHGGHGIDVDPHQQRPAALVRVGVQSRSLLQWRMELCEDRRNACGAEAGCGCCCWICCWWFGWWFCWLLVNMVSHSEPWRIHSKSCLPALASWFCFESYEWSPCFLVPTNIMVVKVGDIDGNGCLLCWLLLLLLLKMLILWYWNWNAGSSTWWL